MKKPEEVYVLYRQGEILFVGPKKQLEKEADNMRKDYEKSFPNGVTPSYLVLTLSEALDRIEERVEQKYTSRIFL